MINCNPETVSTDFDTADKLYFEPVFWEHIYDIIMHEKPVGVIVQLGGQTALKLAEKLEKYGIRILGTDYKSLDLAEDRGSFSTLLKENHIPYPKFGVVESAEQAIELSRELGFPLLVRPSYVLGGQKMKIVINENELEPLRRPFDFLRHYGNLSFKEIAAMTDVSINTALGRMRYALTNMRKIMEHTSIQTT